MDNSELAKRMKDYEAISRTRLMKRCPVIVRIDGKAHHTFTRGFQRPYDEVYMKTMQETAKYLCEHVQGVVLSYQQSDEITLVLVDYETINVSPYFDYKVQKLCSVIASMATMAFSKLFSKNVELFYNSNTTFHEFDDHAEITFNTQEAERLYEVYIDAYKKGGLFDTRVFNIPKDEVTNNIFWRQVDAIRNSTQMLGHAYFSDKELNEKTCEMIKEMLITQKGIDWNDMPSDFKRGSCCVKEYYLVDAESGEEIEGECCTDSNAMFENGLQRSRWVIDRDIPIFKGEGRAYIDKLVLLGD